MDALISLYVAAHARFYVIGLMEYCEAMDELAEMAHAMGYTLNDLALACCNG